MYNRLKVGDIVWTMQTGYALVTSISDTKNYPIMVDGWASYTIDGMWGCRDKYKSLYFDNPFESSDEFAIGFVEWVLKFDNLKNEKKYIIEQLLEMYKKSL
jgi:hypothetical protein